VEVRCDDISIKTMTMKSSSLKEGRRRCVGGAESLLGRPLPLSSTTQPDPHDPLTALVDAPSFPHWIPRITNAHTRTNGSETAQDRRDGQPCRRCVRVHHDPRSTIERQRPRIHVAHDPSMLGSTRSLLLLMSVLLSLLL